MLSKFELISSNALGQVSSNMERTKWDEQEICDFNPRWPPSCWVESEAIVYLSWHGPCIQQVLCALGFKKIKRSHSLPLDLMLFDLSIEQYSFLGTSDLLYTAVPTWFCHSLCAKHYIIMCNPSSQTITVSSAHKDLIIITITIKYDDHTESIITLTSRARCLQGGSSQ